MRWPTLSLVRFDKNFKRSHPVSMRIGIDARPLGVARTGIGNYVGGVLQSLCDIAPEHSYWCYSNKEIKLVTTSSNVHKKVQSWARSIPGSVWHLMSAGISAKRDAIDVFWSTFPILPFGMPESVLRIITVYDLVWTRFPETMTRYNLLVHRSCAASAIRNADIVITISQSTRDDLLNAFDIPEDKVKLVYPGISPLYKNGLFEHSATYIAKRYNTSSEYMAAVGTIEPRKNLSVLVKALGILKRARKLPCPLLIAGAKGWKNSGLFDDIRLSGLADGDIHFLGYVPDEDLPHLYAGARAFLFPSLYEGFGFPPLEAMACGVPVIASDARCMPEVLGDAAVLVSPNSPRMFADAIERVLQDRTLREMLVCKGLSRSGEFSWRRSARQLLDATKDLLGVQDQCLLNV